MTSLMPSTDPSFGDPSVGPLDPFLQSDTRGFRGDVVSGVGDLAHRPFGPTLPRRGVEGTETDLAASLAVDDCVSTIPCVR